MDERETMSWKAFTIRLIEALRWPLAFVIIFYLLREPITTFVHHLLGTSAGQP